jgi:hypothetical protein
METFDQWIATECQNKRVPFSHANKIKAEAIKLATRIIEAYDTMDNSAINTRIVANSEKPDDQLVKDGQAVTDATAGDLVSSTLAFVKA